METAEDACLGCFCGGLIGQPHLERSSLLLPPVLLLLTGEHLEEGDGEKNERTGSLGWVGTPGVFFLESQTVLRSVWVEVWVENQIDFRKRS